MKARGHNVHRKTGLDSVELERILRPMTLVRGESDPECDEFDLFARACKS
jgi:hypothetical protein